MQTNKKIKHSSYDRYVKAINYCISCGYWIEWNGYSSFIKVSRGKHYPYHTINLKPRRYKSQELFLKIINEIGFPKYI